MTRQNIAGQWVLIKIRSDYTAEPICGPEIWRLTSTSSWRIFCVVDVDCASLRKRQLIRWPTWFSGWRPWPSVQDWRNRKPRQYHRRDLKVLQNLREWDAVGGGRLICWLHRFPHFAPFGRAVDQLAPWSGWICRTILRTLDVSSIIRYNELTIFTGSLFQFLFLNMEWRAINRKCILKCKKITYLEWWNIEDKKNGATIPHLRITK